MKVLSKIVLAMFLGLALCAFAGVCVGLAGCACPFASNDSCCVNCDEGCECADGHCCCNDACKEVCDCEGCECQKD